MGIPELILVALALSMDAFAVTIANAAAYPGTPFKMRALMPVAFGAFQGLMPVAGFFLAGLAADFIRTYAGVISFLILGIIGAKMLIDGVSSYMDKKTRSKETHILADAEEKSDADVEEKSDADVGRAERRLSANAERKPSANVERKPSSKPGRVGRKLGVRRSSLSAASTTSTTASTASTASTAPAASTASRALRTFGLFAILTQAVATSIDAFVVGVGFVATGSNIALAASIIAVCTFGCCCLALTIGKRFGALIGQKAEIFGGLILILLGLKAFFF